MASNHVAGHYQVYKEGGDQIARLLVSAAATCASSSPTAIIPNRSVPPAQLLSLANTVASIPVDIPNGMLELIEEVIDARENCANFYTGKGIECSGHRHYLGILRQVHGILKQAQRSRSRRNRSGPRVARPAPSDENHQRGGREMVTQLLGCHEAQEMSQEGWMVAHRKHRRRSERTVPVIC